MTSGIGEGRAGALPLSSGLSRGSTSGDAITAAAMKKEVDFRDHDLRPRQIFGTGPRMTTLTSAAPTESYAMTLPLLMGG